MNILLTLNKKYLKYMISLLRSIKAYNDEVLHIYIFSNDLTISDIAYYEKYLDKDDKFEIIKIPSEYFKNAPVSKRYPYEIYYRVFASNFLPKNINRILYLDPDIIVKGNLKKLYNMRFDDNYLIGSTNVSHFLKKFNQIKNKANKESEYLNTGVLLMNLKKLRKIDNKEKIFNYIKENKNILTLPDQDIIHHFYGDKVKLVSPLIYNLSDRSIKWYNLKNPFHKIDLNWVEENVIILHYFGRNKPWKQNYKGILDVYYHKFEV